MSVLPLRGGRVVERFVHGQSEDSRSAPKCAQLFFVTDATDCIRSEFANTGSVKYIAKLLHAMSRAAYFITAVVLGVVAVFWWFTKWLLTVSYAMEKDSAPGGADVSGVLVVWGKALAKSHIASQHEATKHGCWQRRIVHSFRVCAGAAQASGWAPG